MALLFMDGCDFEVQNTTSLTYATRYNGGGASVTFQQTGRWGGGGIRVGANGFMYKTLSANYATLILNFWLNITAGFDVYLQLMDTTSTNQCTVVFRSSGNIEFRRGSGSGTLIATGTAVHSGGWNWVGVKVLFAGSSTGTYEIRLNNANVLSGTGVTTISNANAYCNNIAFSSPSNVAAGSPVFDDIIIMDTTGSAPLNDFLPQCRIDTVVPNSDIMQGWTRSAGADNYALVDEAQSNGDTDYVSAVAGNSPAAEDRYGTPDYILHETQNFYAAQVSGVVRAEAGAGANSFQLEIISAGTVAAGSAVSVTSTTYQYLQSIWTTDPATGVAWAPAALDDLGMGALLP